MAVDLQVIPSPDVDPTLRAELRTLWREAFEGDFDACDESHAYGGVHVVAVDDDHVVGHASAVPRPLIVDGLTYGAGYVEGVATHPDRQGEGIGSAMMDRLTDELRSRYEVGALSTGRTGFYQRLGWEQWQGPSYVVVDGVPRRSEEEDGGLMVLRFGRSEELDLHASLACHDRAGDAW